MGFIFKRTMIKLQFMKKYLILTTLISTISMAIGAEYSFYLESEFSKGKKEKVTTLELGNQFSITDKTSVGANFYIEKTNTSDEVSKYKYSEYYHKMMFQMEDFKLGMRNMLRYYGAEGGEIHAFYEPRAILRHSSSVGVYQSSGVDLAYRRRFSEEADFLKLVAMVDFKLTDGISYSTMIDSIFVANSKNSELNNKLYLATLFTGLTFDLPYNSSFYVQYKIDVAGKVNDDKKKGIFIGFSKSLNVL
jgi:hypothetical protein